MTIRILVTCSRSWRDWPLMKTELGRVHDRYPDAVLVHGDSPKGDRDAAGIWRGLGGEVEAWPADWKNCDADCRHRGGNHCPYAGLRRNLAMVESSPVLCLAFINRASRGASHCAQAAEDAGIPTVRYEGGRS